MRFLGLGIGHQSQSSHVVPCNKTASNDSVNNTTGDLSRENTLAITHQTLPQRPQVNVNPRTAVDDSQDGDDRPGDSDADADTDADSDDDSDDDDELNGHL